MENGTLYFLTNEGSGVGKEDAVAAEATIVFKDPRPVIRIDPETGRRSTSTGAARVGGTCSVSLRMRFAESYVFLFTDDDVPVQPAPSPATDRIPIDEGWTCRRTRVFRIGDEEFELCELPHDKAEMLTGPRQRSPSQPPEVQQVVGLLDDAERRAVRLSSEELDALPQTTLNVALLRRKPLALLRPVPRSTGSSL